MIKYVSLLIIGACLASCSYPDWANDEVKLNRGYVIDVHFTLDNDNHCRGFITPKTSGGGNIKPRSVTIEGCSIDNQRPR